MNPGAWRVRASGAATGAGRQVIPGDGLLGEPEKPLLILNVMPLLLGATVAWGGAGVAPAAAPPAGPAAPAAPAAPAGPALPAGPCLPAGPGFPANFFAVF